MKVKELIAALSEKPQEYEVFYLRRECIHDVTQVSTAYADGEAEEITGKDFVLIQ